MARSDRFEPGTWRKLAAGVGTLGVVVAGGVSPSTAAPSTGTGAGAPARSTSPARPVETNRMEHRGRWASAPTTASSGCDDDAQVVHTGPIRKGNGTVIGTTVLQYSAACRKVRSIAIIDARYPACTRNASHYDYCGTVYVNHDHTEDPYNGNGCPEHSHGIAFGVNGSRKSQTGWVDDRAIIQQACVLVMYGGDVIAGGFTRPY